MNSFEAQILTPEGTVFDDQVHGVKMPGTLGSFEVKTLHASIISTLEVGHILVRKADGEEEYYSVSGGFAEMHENKLTLLAEAAEHVSQIDIERAREAKNRAKERLESDDASIDKERAKKALKRAENRIQLSMKFTSSMQ